MSKKKHTGAVFTVTAIIALVMGGRALDFNFGLGGDGEDVAANSNNVSSDIGNDAENNTGNDAVITPEGDITVTVTVAPVEPKAYDVIIDKDSIIYNNETFSTVQSLIELICEDAGEREFYVVLHDETAIENTLEDIKNTFDKNGIVWTTAD